MLKTILAGNLGAPAEIRTLDGGRTVISFSVAHTDNWNNARGEKQSKTTWVRCTLWRTKDQSTKIADYLTTGRAVVIEGTPSVNSYINKDGEAAGSLELNVRNIELMGGGGTSSAQPTKSAATSESTTPISQQKQDNEEDLPF